MGFGWLCLKIWDLIFKFFIKLTSKKVKFTSEIEDLLRITSLTTLHILSIYVWKICFEKIKQLVIKAG